MINSIQTRISNFSADNEELGDDESAENSEENVVEATIEDGYYDEENKVTWHVEEDGSMCPIPDGYVGSQVESESNINTGYVIYEGTDEVTDENVVTAKTSRNQYVWIPVDDPSELYGIDSNGKKWGKLYNFSTSSGITANNWSESNEVMSISSSTGAREPDVVKDYDTDSRLITLGLGAETTHDFLIQLETEFNEMIESVEKYGGFYIGRYETGKLSQDTAVVVQMDTDIGYQTWYTMYSKCKTLSGDNENVVTGMIWGCQWDKTLIWLVESGNKTIDEICDSISWGNYWYSTFEYTNTDGETVTKNANSTTLIPTGSTEYTNVNNIYDLAGNEREWTLETLYENSRRIRGGVYHQNNQVCERYFADPVNTSKDWGCRVTLYIK